MRAFDLDSFEADRPTWIGFLGTIAPATFWEPLFSPDGYWDSRTRLEEVDVALKKDMGFGIDRLRRDATAFFRQTYTHVLVYHGTRILDEPSYRIRGLLRSSIEELNATARRMFGDTEQMQRAISKLRVSRYVENNSGRVGVWYSRRSLLAHGSYCFRGSEYLHLLSRELGPENHERMISAGRGAVICCRMPIGEVEEFCASLAELAVKHLFRIVDPNAPESMYLEDHSPMLERDIPPEWLEIEFVPE